MVVVQKLHNLELARPSAPKWWRGNGGTLARRIAREEAKTGAGLRMSLVPGRQGARAHGNRQGRTSPWKRRQPP